MIWLFLTPLHPIDPIPSKVLRGLSMGGYARPKNYEAALGKNLYAAAVAQGWPTGTVVVSEDETLQVVDHTRKALIPAGHLLDLIGIRHAGPYTLVFDQADRGGMRAVLDTALSDIDIPKDALARLAGGMDSSFLSHVFLIKILIHAVDLVASHHEQVKQGMREPVFALTLSSLFGQSKIDGHRMVEPA